MTTTPVYQGVTAIEVRVFAALGQQVLVLADDRIGVNLEVDGSLVGDTTYLALPNPGLSVLQTCSSTDFGPYGWREQTYANVLNQTQVDNLRIFIARQQTGLVSDAIRVAQAEVIVTYTDPPSLEQSAYRIYQNTDSPSPGTPLQATNTVADVPQGSDFRVRIGTTVSGEDWSVGYGSNKLQYTAKNDTSCATSSGWTDVSSLGAIQWKDNASVADGVSIAADVNDPATSGTKIYQQYRESNDFTNPVSIDALEVAIWDFSLSATTVEPGMSYCLRIVNVDGSINVSHSYYVEIIATGEYGVAFVDEASVEVLAPSVAFSGASVSTSGCQLTTGVLGTSAEKLRISNDVATNGWSVSISATDGQASQWTSGDEKYDFNDLTGSPPGCSDGADADTTAGYLGVAPLAGQITSKPGCSTTGISLGSSAGFEQGITDAITLATASSVADRFCYWDITDIVLQQQIPSTVPAGSYGLDMTITITAF
jgi:hypothetical protein